MRRLVFLITAAAAVLVLSGPVIAQTEPAGEPVLVADVRGPLDQRALDFLEEAVSTPDVQLVVIQINNAGISSGDPTALYEAVASSSTPIAVWVGPAGAVAYGGAGQLLLAADATGAAPGTRVGYLEPVVIRADVAGVAAADAQRSAAGTIDDSL